MFTILYFLVRIMLYKPKVGYDFFDMMGDLIIDPITFVFAGSMIAAVIATRMKRKDVERKKFVTGSAMGVVLYLTTFAALMTREAFKLPDAKFPQIMIIYLSMAICILSLIFILISVEEGRGVVDGLIDMFDFEMQGILWIVLGFVCLMIMLLPIVFVLMAGVGSGSSDDDDDFWWWFFLLR